MPRISGRHQKVGEKHGMESSSELPEGTNPVIILMLEFCPLEREKIKMYCFKLPCSWLFVMVALGPKGKEQVRAPRSKATDSPS